MALGAIALLVGPLAWLVGGQTVTSLQGKEQADAINAVRQTLLTAATGLAAFSALVFTGRSFFLNRRGQLTDRYAKAVSLLASDRMAERVGGVFALEHLMRESERDHDTVVHVLAAFVRERRPLPVDIARADGRDPAYQGVGPRDRPPSCPTDVQAALTVLARRLDRTEFAPVDLTYSDLTGADLRNGRLAGTQFQGSLLQDAVLHNADLSAANFQEATLIGAVLGGAALHRANFVRADLRHAILGGASLTGASLMNADLRFVSAPGANLRHAHMLQARLEESDLSRADLRDTYSVEASLDSVILFGADFSAADLHRADLGAADLRHATFTDADLTGARAGSLTREQLEHFMDERLATLGQIPADVFETVREADPDHANWTGIVCDEQHHALFAQMPSVPAPPARPGFVIGHEPPETPS